MPSHVAHTHVRRISPQYPSNIHTEKYTTEMTIVGLALIIHRVVIFIQVSQFTKIVMIVG